MDDAILCYATSYSLEFVDGESHKMNGPILYKSRVHWYQPLLVALEHAGH